MAAAPLLVFGASVVYVNLAGVTAVQAYLAPLLVAIGLAIVLARDKSAACEAMIATVADPTMAIMIFAFLGAGVLGTLLLASGVIQAVVWAAALVGVGPTAFVILSFVAAAVVSTATGTSTGACVTCVPVLYPSGVLLGAHPALLLGAIYSGARFGDNLAPISNTTVASALTQDAGIDEVVRTRVKYALVAAGASAILYAIAGSLVGTNEPTAEPPNLDIGANTRPEALWMLLAPAATIYLCLRGKSLIHAIWYGILAAILIGLTTRTLTVSGLYHLQAPSAVSGALTAGLANMRDVVLLTILIMAVVGVLKRTTLLDALVATVLRFATTVRRAEFAIFLLVAIVCPLCAANTPGILFCGPVVKHIGRQFDVPGARRANLMSLSANGVTLSLPHVNTILALAGVMIACHEATGVPLVSLPAVGLFAFHPMMLTIVGLVAITTGWGARRG